MQGYTCHPNPMPSTWNKRAKKRVGKSQNPKVSGGKSVT
jgi:hypothetical protein